MSRRHRNPSNSFTMTLVEIGIGVLGLFLGYHLVIVPMIQRAMTQGH